MKYFFKTYGCQMNQNDSVLIESLMATRGYGQAENIDQADLLIVNTCSVRAHAEARAGGFIASLARWKRARSDRVLCICGCMAQRYGVKLLERYPWIDILIGPDRYRKIYDYLEEVRTKRSKVCDLSLTGETYCGIKPFKTGTISSYVSIMRGCDNYCSFCIIPYLRGRARSRPTDDIIDEIKSLIDQGVKEITLLGQNVNAYKFNKVHFADLLEMINQIKGLLRIRFMTSHPADMSEEILRAVAGLDKVCEYIHLPFQSGSDRILGLMNRKYSSAQYKEIVNIARNLIPGLALSTDVIVGFPTEAEDDYQATYRLMSEIEFDFAYMFKYSPHKETGAFRLEPKVDPAVAQRRLDEIIRLQNRITRQKNAGLIGQKVEVLIEGNSYDKKLMGKTRDNRMVIFEGKGNIGDLVWVQIEKLNGWTPVGFVVITA
ncbi:MAG: tRNA (N6-isopentenyl adenosine(37)-C2)-methylthiotransferase MiaB [candidate division WOR-3 bacterium]